MEATSHTSEGSVATSGSWLPWGKMQLCNVSASQDALWGSAGLNEKHSHDLMEQTSSSAPSPPDLLQQLCCCKMSGGIGTDFKG